MLQKHTHKVQLFWEAELYTKTWNDWFLELAGLWAAAKNVLVSLMKWFAEQKFCYDIFCALNPLSLKSLLPPAIHIGQTFHFHQQTVITKISVIFSSSSCWRSLDISRPLWYIFPNFIQKLWGMFSILNKWNNMFQCMIKPYLFWKWWKLVHSMYVFGQNFYLSESIDYWKPRTFRV